MSTIYPPSAPEIATKRRELSPNQDAAFDALDESIFAEGALPAKTKQIIAVAVAHITQSPLCIQSHTKAALRSGATAQELMEAIWVAAKMRANGTYSHARLMVATLNEEQE